jgi:hypothetical protein
MSDSRLDIERDKYMEWKEQQRWSRRDYCYQDCGEHNESCPYYDPEEETFDYEECFRDSGGLL